MDANAGEKRSGGEGAAHKTLAHLLAAHRRRDVGDAMASASVPFGVNGHA